MSIAAVVAATLVAAAQPESIDRMPDFGSQEPYRARQRELLAAIPGPNAYEAVMEARRLLDGVREEVQLFDQPYWMPFDALLGEAEEPHHVEVAREMLRLSAGRGIEPAIARIAKGRGVVRPLGDGLAIMDLLPDLITVRQCSKINLILMREDARAGDWERWLEKLDQLLRIARAYREDSYLIGIMIGFAVESTALLELERVVDQRVLDAAQLERVAGLLDGLGMRERPTRGIEASRLVIKAAIDYVYERNSWQRVGYLARVYEDNRLAPPNDAGLPLSEDPPIAGWVTRAAAHASVDELHDNAVRLLSLPFRERIADPFKIDEYERRQSIHKNPVVAMTLPAIAKYFASIGQIEAEQAGARAMVALEWYRAEHGRLPASLGELVPRYVAEVPRDYFSGGGLVYKGPREGGYEGGREYLLYSVGYDLTDNDGKCDPKSRVWAVTETGKGLDFVVNPAPKVVTRKGE
ncbi:MAG TPA: hypothetical protein VD997_09170 [Phycisphaerales bacterium]|nr:hypothetical protein [Phycisphaerales bacterium]